MKVLLIMYLLNYIEEIISVRKFIEIIILFSLLVIVVIGCSEESNNMSMDSKSAGFCDGYMEGDLWKVDCNTCECTFEGIICSEINCNEEELCDGYKIGDTWLATDKCNTCFCGEDKIIACTNKNCTGDDACLSFEETFETLINANNSCYNNDDCIIIEKECNLLFGKCYINVNNQVDVESLLTLGEKDCTDIQCDCPGPVKPIAKCVEGICVHEFPE